MIAVSVPRMPAFPAGQTGRCSGDACKHAWTGHQHGGEPYHGPTERYGLVFSGSCIALMPGRGILVYQSRRIAHGQTVPREALNAMWA